LLGGGGGEKTKEGGRNIGGGLGKPLPVLRKIKSSIVDADWILAPRGRVRK